MLRKLTPRAEREDILEHVGVTILERVTQIAPSYWLARQPENIKSLPHLRKIYPFRAWDFAPFLYYNAFVAVFDFIPLKFERSIWSALSLSQSLRK